MASALVKFDDLLDAFEFVSGAQPMEHEAYLCIETAVIYYCSELGDSEELIPDDIDDVDKYVAIPHKNDLDLGTRLAIRFADEHLADAGDDVQELFRHKGAYRRFRNLIERRGVLQQWYDFEDKSKKEALHRWCEDNGIKTQG
jgi:hypothetical protein